MKLKILSLALALVMLISLVPTATLAADATCDHEGGFYTPSGNGHHTSYCKKCGEVADGPNPCNDGPKQDGLCWICQGSMNPDPNCVHDGGSYIPSGNGHHTSYCKKCGEVADGPNPCDEGRTQDGLCWICQGVLPPACDHIRNDPTPNGDGTHTSSCDCGKVSVGPTKCFSINGSTCISCGGNVKAEEVCEHTDLNIRNNNDGTHSYICRYCAGPVVVSTEEHSYNEFGICNCGAVKPAPTCDHKRNDWTSNGDGTHTSACDCGEESVTYNCLFDDNGYCRTCKTYKPCDHVCDNWSSNGDGTHSASCDCGENKVGPYDCQPLLAGGSTCHTCGADMPAKPVCQHEYHGAVNNYNGTHSIVCSDCTTPLYNEAHSYNAYDVCVCGAIKPVCLHKNHDYVNNGANHTVTCDDCSKSLYTEDHDFGESGTCVCGAAEPKCDHKRQGHSIVNNGDGTHSTLCAKCKAVLHTEAHSFSDLHNCGCGAVKPFYVPEKEPVEEAPYYPEDSWNRLDDLFVTFK